MFNKINKNFFIGSFLTHIAFIVLIVYVNLNNSINKKFIVYGAHSKKPTNAYFKPSRQINKSNRLNNNNDRHSGTKKLAQNTAPSQIKNLSKNKKPPIKELSSKSTKKHSIKTKNKTSKNKNFKNKKSKQKSPTSMEEPKKQVNSKKIQSQTKQTKKNKKQKKEVEKKIKKEEKELKKDKEKKKQEKIKSEEKKPEEPKETEFKEKPEPETEKTEEAAKLPKSQEAEKPEALNFDLLEEQDPKLVTYQKLIQKEVDRLWHPPLGVSKGTESLILFKIDKDGNVAKYEVIEKSNVLIYDLSIFRVAKNFKFDKSLWNKEFTIRFRQ